MAVKHVEDVFIPECKTGPSHRGLLIMDAWAMAKSWAHPQATAYEIKCSRSDFLQDDKWQGYLKYCNSFYFVCPAKLIQPEELPAEVGLLWASKTGTMLYTKRKAVYRKLDVPNTLYQYLMMNRVKISRDYGPDMKAFWTEWLKEKKLNHDFGYRVSREIRKTVDDEMRKLRDENRRALELVDKYRNVQHILHSLGFDELDVRSYSFQSRLTKKLEEIKLGVGQDLVDYLRQLVHNAKAAIDILDKPVLDSPGVVGDNSPHDGPRSD